MHIITHLGLGSGQITELLHGTAARALTGSAEDRQHPPCCVGLPRLGHAGRCANHLSQVAGAAPRFNQKCNRVSLSAAGLRPSDPLHTSLDFLQRLGTCAMMSGVRTQSAPLMRCPLQCIHTARRDIDLRDCTDV